MGYTHYWTHVRDFPADEWQTIRDDIGAILKDVQHVQGIALADWRGDGGTAPELTDDLIAFNGLGDDGCESFVIERKRTLESWQTPDRLGWSFCKTARGPYDLAVTACLCYLATIAESHTVTSDGHGHEWLDGLEEARRALPRHANRLDIPRGILESDRWCMPWVSDRYTKGYSFNFCVDGHAYIIRQKDGASYRFRDHREAAEWLQRNGGNDLWDATGWFDEERNRDLSRRQTAALSRMVERAADDPERMVPPPALVRPGEIPEPPTRAYYFSDLLNVAA